MNEKQLQLLKAVSGLLHIDSEPQATYAIYIPPAQALRNAADAMERKESIIRDFRKELFFWENGEYPKEPEIYTIGGDLIAGNGTTTIGNNIITSTKIVKGKK